MNNYHGSVEQDVWSETIGASERREGSFAGIVEMLRKKEKAKIAAQKNYYICIDCHGIGYPRCERCKGSGRYDYKNNHPLPRRRMRG